MLTGRMADVAARTLGFLIVRRPLGLAGLGPAPESTLAQQGFDVTHAIGRLREYTEAVRLLWSE
jgi:hypothetical protein